MRRKQLDILKTVMLSLMVMCLAFVMNTVTAQAAAPGKVTNVKQTDASGTNVKIVWDTVLGSNVRYESYISTDNVNWTYYDYTTSTYEYISNLTPGRTYFVKVRAYSRVSYDSEWEYGAYSDAIQVVTAPNATDITVTQIDATTNSMKLAWTAVDGATSYDVYTKMNASGHDYVLAGSATTNGVVLSNLAAGTEYYVQVVAKRTSAQGFAVEGSYETYYDAKTLPGKVTGVINDIWYPSIKKLYVECDPIQSADGYEMIVYNYKGKKKVKTVTSTSNELCYTKANPKNSYIVKVRAYSVINGVKKYGEYSNKAVMVGDPVVKLQKSNGKLTIKWNKVAGATGYDVYVSTNKDGNYKKVKSLKAKKTSLTISKLKGKKIKSNKKYYVYVTAKRKYSGKTYKSNNYYYYYR